MFTSNQDNLVLVHRCMPSVAGALQLLTTTTTTTTATTTTNNNDDSNW